MKIFRTILLCSFYLTPIVVCGQIITKSSAENKFESRNYAQAIPLFEKLLVRDPDTEEYQIKLAECYRQIKDYRNANRLYAILAHKKNATPQMLWYYAQTLAQLEKYSEASEWYDQYNRIGGNPIAKRYSAYYKNLHTIFGDTSKYDIHFLYSINSWQSDFSPTLFENGLVFCSGRNHDGAIRRVSGHDNTSLLEWYYVMDTANISLDLSTQNDRIKYSVNKSKNMSDDFSKHRSNDSPIPGHYAQTFLFDSVHYKGHHKAKVKKIGTSFDRHHVGPLCFVDNEKVFFTANYRDPDSKIDHLAIYTAVVDNGKFKKIKKLPLDWSGYSVGHPAYSQRDKKLYFTSNQPDGKGGTDIYYSTYKNGAWSIPTNLEEVNTPGNECFPYIDAAGNLYFSSDYHPGLGGLDIFKTRINTGQVEAIEHLDYPINSSKDDFGITFTHDLMQGYLSSNRKRGFSDDDIYYFKRACRTQTIRVVNDETDQPLAGVRILTEKDAAITGEQGQAKMCLSETDTILHADLMGFEPIKIIKPITPIEIRLKPLQFSIEGVVIRDSDQQILDNVLVELIDIDRHYSSVNSRTTDSTGHYQFELNRQINYEIATSKDRCGTNRFQLTLSHLTHSKVFQKDIVMLCEGDIVEIENIYYDLNEATLTASALTSLEELISLMNKYPDMRIELRSHTDSRGSTASNMNLSARRAQSVVDHLINNGIVPFRLRAVGLGESEPLNDCTDENSCTEEEHQINRRTEFKVLSIDQSDFSQNIITNIK
jgi:outer membrane protein OmpA-like peptidoglycan-associated protein